MSGNTVSEATGTTYGGDRYVGKVAAVTGVASGMGRCIALRLASEGATVFGMDIDAEGLDEVAAEVAEVAEAGGTITTRVTDIAEPAQCREAIAECVRAARTARRARQHRRRLLDEEHR